MKKKRAGIIFFYVLVCCLGQHMLIAQCPQFPTSSITGNNMILCEGGTVTLSVTGEDIAPGSTVNWYIGEVGTFDPYNGEGILIGSVPVLPDPLIPGEVLIADFNWDVPSDFCESSGGGAYWVAGILDPPPAGACIEITTEFFGLEISCPAMMLTGGGEVCEGNCPEDPTEITFTIVGDDTPFIGDLVVTAPLFPAFDIEDIEISDGQSISVCLEGFFPSFDPATGILNVPVLAIGITVSVEVVAMTSASGCPVTVDPNFIELTFIGAPSANAGADQTICAGEVVNISGSIGGTATTSIWSTDGDGSFGNPANLATTYIPGADDISNGQVQLTLMGMDQNGSCIPASSSLTVIINPSLSIEVNTPLTICDNDIASISALVTGSSEPCSWETSGDGDFDDPDSENTFYIPGPGDIQDGSVTLSYVPVDPDACLNFSEPLELTIVPAPDVDIPQNLEVCAGDSIEIEIDIDGDFTNVIWSASGDGILDIASDFFVTYTPGPLDINNQFFIVSVMIQSAFPECGVTTYNLPVNIFLCDCPDFESIPPGSALCALSSQLDLSSLLVAGGTGTWSITSVPPGLNPATLSGNVFTTNLSDPGVYTVTYTLNSPEIGCPETTTEIIEVSAVSQPDAGPDLAFCGPQSIQLDGQITPMVPLFHQWESSGDGIFADPTELNTAYMPGPIDAMSPGFYLILRLMDPVCGDQADSLTVFFNTPPSTQFVNDTVSVCNSAMNGSILNFWTLITGGDASGTWTNISGVPVDFTDPSSVNFDGIAEGFYLFQYETNTAQSPCSETLYSMIISVEECSCPLLVVQNLPDGICNDLAGLPLDAFLMAGAPGTWQIISTPPGSNPGSIAGSIFVLNGCDPGVYGIRFTFDAAPIPACPDSAEISIIVQEPPMVNITGDTSTCGFLPVMLTAVIGGSATGVQWTTTGSGSFNFTDALNTLYTPSIFDLAATQLSLIASSVDTFGHCAISQDTILLFLVTPPSTTFSSLADTLCNQADSGSVINLTALIVEGDATGFWTDIDGALVDLNDPTQVDFDGVAPGEYRLRYTTQTALLPCIDSMYTLVVLVEDCACPPLVISQMPLLLCSGDTSDLSLQEINAAPGSWSIESGPGGIWPVITGDILNTTGAASGSYTLRYTLTDSVAGCATSSMLLMTIEEVPFFDVISKECDQDEIFYEVLIQTDANFISADTGIVNDLGGGQFRIDSVPTGQNVQLLIFGASGICAWTFDVIAPDCNCTLLIENIADTITFCPGDTFVLIPFITGAQGFALSTWVTPDGIMMRPTLPLYEEGEYIWIVRDEAGCEERDTFNTEFMGPEGALLSAAAPSCPGYSDGQVIVESVIEGSPPFMIQLDNGIIEVVVLYPYIISNVPAGNHVVFITDMIGCTLELTVTVDDKDVGVLDLGPDRSIPKGDSVQIIPVVDNIEIGEVTWSPDFPGLGIESFWFAPLVTTLLSVMVSDTAGCQYQDDLLVTVLENETFFIPNIFSPNGDQINDEMIIITNLPPDRIVSLEIFDRWGGLMHKQYENPPFQWDGTSSDQDVQSGVYTYKLNWKDLSENLNVKVGSITLVR